jgi:predicted DNA-binding protein with PD1-like motif
MQYDVGSVGRVVVARLSEGEELYECIESLATKESIASAAVFITGGLRKADVVVGPKEETPKIVGDFRKFVGPGEVLGVGTIYSDDEGPKMHIHSAMGRGDNVIVGCPRGGAHVFLVLEVTIIEITGTTARRELDESCGIKLLKVD